MRIDDARQVATTWVNQHAAPMPGFCGAFLTGSVLGSSDGPLPPTSDVDIKIVLAAETLGPDGSEPNGACGASALPPQTKFWYHAVLLEVSYMWQSELADADSVATTDYLAAALQADSLLSDPTGRLAELHDDIAAGYATRTAVERRVNVRADGIRAALGNPDRTTPWPEQVMRWLFPTTLTTHLVLNATLRAPTVRKRYVALRQALADHDRLCWYREFLADLGCANLDARTTQRHLDRLTQIYDQAGAMTRSRFFFSADLLPQVRPVAIDGSQQLIDSGRHREAVFWIMATFCRCQLQLLTDAPAIARLMEDSFDAAAADLLSISGADDLDRRGARTMNFIDRLQPLISELIEHHVCWA